MQFEVYREGEIFKHPVSGEILGVEKIPTGKLQITEIQENLAFARVIEQKTDETVAVGHNVVSMGAVRSKKSGPIIGVPPSVGTSSSLRFVQAWGAHNEIEFIPRKTVVTTICLNPRAKDSNIRQAMINKYGSPGTKKAPGVLYGVKRDMWQALGLAHAWIEIRHLLSYQEDQLFN